MNSITNFIDLLDKTNYFREDKLEGFKFNKSSNDCDCDCDVDIEDVCDCTYNDLDDCGSEGTLV